MSKEIALLVRAFTAIDSRDFPVLCKEIEELLAQPEHTEKEPVAWMYEWDTTTTGQPTCKYVNMGKDKPNVEANFLARNFIPLYTTPPKLQPLSEAEITNFSKKSLEKFNYSDADGDNNWAFRINEITFARLIEKAHGIGGGE